MQKLTAIVLFFCLVGCSLSALAYDAWDWREDGASAVALRLEQLALEMQSVIEAAAAANAAHPDFLRDLRQTVQGMLELAERAPADLPLSVREPADPTVPRDTVRDIMPVAVGSPAGHWVLDDAAQGTARDVSGHGHHGTVVGPHPSTDPFGREGHAYYFSGTARPDHHIDLGNSPRFTGLDRFSVAAWIRPMGFDSEWSTIMSQHNIHGDGEWYIAVRSRGFRFAHIDGNGVRRNRHFDYDVPLEEWMHVAVTFDNGAVSFYVNGIELGTAEVGEGTNATSWPLLIGTIGGDSWGRGWSFWGCMYDVRLYDYAVSSSDVASMAAVR